MAKRLFQLLILGHSREELVSPGEGELGNRSLRLAGSLPPPCTQCIKEVAGVGRQSFCTGVARWCGWL